MINIKKNELKEYYRDVRRLLPYITKRQKNFLISFKCMVEQYVNENPFCSIKEVKYNFGEPKDIVSNYLLSLDSSCIRSALKRKKIIQILCIVIISAIFLVGTIKMVESYNVYIDGKSHYIYEEETVIGEF